MDDSTPVAADDAGCLPDNARIRADDLDVVERMLDAGCPVPARMTIVIGWTPSLEDKLKPYMPPETTHQEPHAVVPAAVKAPVSHGDIMVPESEDTPPPAPAHHEEPPVPAPTAPAPTTTATVQAPGSAATELIGLVQSAGGNAGLAVVLAVVAVLGGGTAFKFYSQSSKQKHEERMKRIENEQDSHQQCTAARLQLEAKLAQLETKVDGISQKTASFSISDDVEERIEELEKQLKQKTTRKKST